ncbi:MAG: hypothetical protein QM790_17560 [Nibricoccus sp.]
MADTPPTNNNSDSPKKPARKLSLQDQQQANDINATQQLLGMVQAKSALKAALAKIGYDDKEMAIGAMLQATAFEKYSSRQTKLASTAQDLSDRDEVSTDVEDEFSSFRQTVQALYKGADRATLGASGEVSHDREVFATQARAAYTAAQKDPYASKLATRGFPPERVAAALEALTGYTGATTTAKSSRKATPASTKERNASVKAMNDWVTELRRIAKANLKKNPELQALVKE